MFGEGGIPSHGASQPSIPITGDTRLQHVAPRIGALEVAGAQRAALQVAALVENGRWQVQPKWPLSVENIGTPHECVRRQHAAFGKIALFDVSSNVGVPMFGSSLEHRNFKSIELSRASLDRHLNNDWIRDGDTILRASMTPSQWAQFVASMGTQRGQA